VKLLMQQFSKPAVFLDRDGVLDEAIVLNTKPDLRRDLTKLVITHGAGPNVRSWRAKVFGRSWYRTNLTSRAARRHRRDKPASLPDAAFWIIEQSRLNWGIA
jgi:hypothetical protein